MTTHSVTANDSASFTATRELIIESMAAPASVPSGTTSSRRRGRSVSNGRALHGYYRNVAEHRPPAIAVRRMVRWRPKHRPPAAAMLGCPAAHRTEEPDHDDHGAVRGNRHAGRRPDRKSTRLNSSH